MKKNLLPAMQRVRLADKSGDEFVLEIELRRSGEQVSVFLSDSHQVGSSRLAEDAMYYIEKIASRLRLDGKRTIFYRHIYQEQNGSQFGRFDVDWQAAGGPSYKFRMLTDLEDLRNIDQLLKNSRVVSVQEQVGLRKSA